MQSDVMLARLPPSGMFELLNGTAWARALGYLPKELSGKSLGELLALESGAAGEIVAAPSIRMDRPARGALARRANDFVSRCFSGRAAPGRAP